MRLVNLEYDLEINISTEYVTVLCIEKPSVFTSFIRDISNQCENKDGSWVLSQDGEQVNFSKNVLCVINPIALDLNDKKLVKVLYQDISTDVINNMDISYGEVKAHIISFLDEVISHQQYDLTFDDGIAIADMLKLYNVSFADDSESILEKIVFYIRLWHSVAGVEVCVFVNLKAYLLEEEMTQLYEMVRYEQVYLVLLESHFTDKLDGEKLKILDKDLCIIES